MREKIIVPKDYDYVGVYLTDRCHLDCPYCITTHHNSPFSKKDVPELRPEEWVIGLNRLELPKDVPITLQGGEPFLYKGIWKILEDVRHKIDILTALPPFVKKSHFLNLKTLEWNNRRAPYPTIRVSFHRGENDYKELVERIAELQEILNIGLYYLEYPSHSDEELAALGDYAKKFNVELRSKEFLGESNGRVYGTFLYPDAALGRPTGVKVLCRNTVVPIGQDGNIYRCHSDLYFSRPEGVLGNLLGEVFEFPDSHLYCDNYGLCSVCDVKIKTNHEQIYGYTSVDIKFINETRSCRIDYGAKKV